MNVNAAYRDWVEELTGAPGPSFCQRHGHDKVQCSEPKIVNGHPAAHFKCTVCGELSFHWCKGDKQ